MKPRDIMAIWSDGTYCDRGLWAFEIVRDGDLMTIDKWQVEYWGA